VIRLIKRTCHSRTNLSSQTCTVPWSICISVLSKSQTLQFLQQLLHPLLCPLPSGLLLHSLLLGSRNLALGKDGLELELRGLELETAHLLSDMVKFALELGTVVVTLSPLVTKLSRKLDVTRRSFLYLLESGLLSRLRKIPLETKVRNDVDGLDNDGGRDVNVTVLDRPVARELRVLGKVVVDDLANLEGNDVSLAVVVLIRAFPDLPPDEGHSASPLDLKFCDKALVSLAE
jgi:hypothetical protein